MASILTRVASTLRREKEPAHPLIRKPLAHWAEGAMVGVLVYVIQHDHDRLTVTLQTRGGTRVLELLDDLRERKGIPYDRGTLVSLALGTPDEKGVRQIFWVYEGDAPRNIQEYNRRYWIAG